MVGFLFLYETQPTRDGRFSFSTEKTTSAEALVNRVLPLRMSRSGHPADILPRPSGALNEQKGKENVDHASRYIRLSRAFYRACDT